MLITSVNNEKIKEIVKLKEKKYRDQLGLFVVEGMHDVEEAHKAHLIKELYVLEGVFCNYDEPINYVNKNVMNKISNMECISDYFAICYKKKELDIGNRILILDGIQDPGNLGTIIRSAVAFNMDTVVLSLNCVDMYNPKVIRSTKGMLFNINIIVRKLESFISELTDYTIYGTDVDFGIDVKKENIPLKMALVIGNEGSGISNEVKTLCDRFLYINMSDKCESLNASVAASILMYEVDNK